MKPESTWRGLRRLFAHAGDGRRLVVAGYSLILVDALAQVTSPAVFREVINRIERDPEAFLDGGWQGPAAWATAIALTFIVSAYLAHTWTRRGATRWANNLRRTLYEHVQRLSVDYFMRTQIGDTAARIGQDIERLEVTIWQGLAVLWSVVMLVVAVGLIAWVDLWMAILSVGLLAIAAAWTAIVFPRLRRQTREVRDRLGATSGTLTELLGVNALLKAFNAEDASSREVRQKTGIVRQRTEALARLQHRYADPLGLHLAFVAPFLLLFAGAWRVASDTMMIGDVVAVWAFWVRGSGALTLIVNNVPELLAGIAAGERATALLDEQPRVRDEKDAVPLQVTHSAVRFESVGFAYPSRPTQPVLRDFDLEIPAGARVALVGPSGAGKSTVAQLLLRFFDPTDGRVTIDGQDLRQVDQQSVRAAVGIVFQDSTLLSGSLADNLRLANESATDEELQLALAAAQAWDFVERWDAGLDTEVGERGVSISGGQRQRIAIARMLLKDPPIVILDEATSALDATSEHAVLRAFDRLLVDRTSLVIAHRIATVRNADRIAVIEHGAVVAVGAHDDLLSSSSTYRTYCEQQLVR